MLLFLSCGKKNKKEVAIDEIPMEIEVKRLIKYF
jgi:hypothetical protein